MTKPANSYTTPTLESACKLARRLEADGFGSKIDPTATGWKITVKFPS